MYVSVRLLNASTSTSSPSAFPRPMHMYTQLPMTQANRTP